VTEGGEDRVYEQSVSKRTGITNTIVRKQESAFWLYQENPRMVPGLNFHNIF
jgi:hypothetical protein